MPDEIKIPIYKIALTIRISEQMQTDIRRAAVETGLTQSDLVRAAIAVGVRQILQLRQIVDNSGKKPST